MGCNNAVEKLRNTPKIDKESPTVKTPQPSGEGVHVGTDILVYFSETMDEDSFTSGYIKLVQINEDGSQTNLALPQNDNKLVYHYDSEANALSISTAGLLKTDTKYQMTLLADQTNGGGRCETKQEMF